MKITASIFFAAVLVVGTSCSHLPRERQTHATQSSPGSSDSEKRSAEAMRSIQAGLPFEVSFPPANFFGNDLIESGEFDHMKQKFLRPLAASKYAKKIRRVVVDAPSGEWYQWKCRVELTEFLAPISLTHYAGFYDANSNTDPDAYSASRAYVLGELNRMGRRLGWE